ncbi:DUF4136 domain-containing protein [Marinilabiliaceae bacterium JC017]|nr:DUF4136 domain-containing protein [Marinilabiliaceae bacterium JC017]
MRLTHLFVLLLVVFSGGCSSFKTTVDWDPSVDFRGFKSFNFSQSFDEIRLNDLDKRRVKEAVTIEMEKRGLHLSDKPELLVNGYVTSKEKVVVTNTHYSGMSPYAWGPWYSTTDVNSYREGTLLIGLIDVKQTRLIWEGRAVGVADQSGGKQRTGFINKVIEDMFREYPIK